MNESLLAQSRPVTSPIPTLIDYLIEECSKTAAFTQHQVAALNHLRDVSVTTLRNDPPVGVRYESSLPVLRLRSGKEVTFVGLDSVLNPGDGGMAPEPAGPTHIQV